MTTKGEYRVGIAFNPSADSMVDKIKRAAADFIDLVETIDGDGERARLKALAQTEIESAAMWAVKAATKPTAPGVLAQPQTERQGDDIFTEIVRGAIAACDKAINHTETSHPVMMLAAEMELRKRGFVSWSDAELAQTVQNIRQGRG